MHNTGKLILLTVLFAFLGILVRIIDSELSVFTQMFWRMLAAALISSCFRGDPFQLRALTRKDIGVGIFRSFLLTVIGGGCWIWAISIEKLGVVSFLTCLPFEAFWGVVLFGERLTKKQTLGFLIALAGAGLLHHFSLDLFDSKRLGTVLALIAGLGWGLGVGVSKWHSANLSNSTMSLLSLWTGAVWAGFCVLVSNEPFRMPTTQLVWLALFLSITIVLWTSLLLGDLARKVPLTTLALVGLTQPALAAFLGYVFFDEKLTVQESLGCFLILVGSMLPAFKISASSCASRLKKTVQLFTEAKGVVRQCK